MSATKYCGIHHRIQEISPPSGDVFESFQLKIWNSRKLSVMRLHEAETLATFCRTKNHGPIMVHESVPTTLVRFWEPPASRIFNHYPLTGLFHGDGSQAGVRDGDRQSTSFQYSSVRCNRAGQRTVSRRRATILSC